MFAPVSEGDARAVGVLELLGLGLAVLVGEREGELLSVPVAGGVIGVHDDEPSGEVKPCEHEEQKALGPEAYVPALQGTQ